MHSPIMHLIGTVLNYVQGYIYLTKTYIDSDIRNRDHTAHGPFKL